MNDNINVGTGAQRYRTESFARLWRADYTLYMLDNKRRNTIVYRYNRAARVCLVLFILLLPTGIIGLIYSGFTADLGGVLNFAIIAFAGAICLRVMLWQAEHKLYLAKSHEP